MTQPLLHSATALFPSNLRTEHITPLQHLGLLIAFNVKLFSAFKGLHSPGTVCALQLTCLCFCCTLPARKAPIAFTCLIKSYASFKATFKAIFLVEPSLIFQMERTLLGIPMELHSNNYLSLPRNMVHAHF